MERPKTINLKQLKTYLNFLFPDNVDWELLPSGDVRIQRWSTVIKPVVAAFEPFLVDIVPYQKGRNMPGGYVQLLDTIFCLRLDYEYPGQLPGSSFDTLTLIRTEIDQYLYFVKRCNESS